MLYVLTESCFYIVYLFMYCSWFAVHCTSMNNTNHLISSDNKGYASQMFEMAKNGGKFPAVVSRSSINPEIYISCELNVKLC